MNETLLVRDGNVLARCYSKQELISAIKEHSGITLKKESVLRPMKREETDRIAYDSYGVTYTPVKDGMELNNHGYHRNAAVMNQRIVEEGIWDEMLHSAWFYTETGIELFEKTSFS